MNKRIILGIILFAIGVSFCGCTLMEPVSDDDITAIASYSAKMVAKYNKKQKDGLVYIDNNDIDALQLEEVKKAQSSVNTSSTNSSSSASNTTSQNTSGNTQTTPQVPMSSALGLSGVDMSYQGIEVRDSYTTSIFDMSPNPGNKYLVMKFRVTNTSGGDNNVDVLSMNPKFKATINGNISANNELTLMPEDLSTFKGIIKAGESQDVILLFQFKAGDLSNVQGASLKCTVKGSTNDIIL